MCELINFEDVEKILKLTKIDHFGQIYSYLATGELKHSVSMHTLTAIPLLNRLDSVCTIDICIFDLDVLGLEVEEIVYRSCENLYHFTSISLERKSMQV